MWWGLACIAQAHTHCRTKYIRDSCMSWPITFALGRETGMTDNSLIITCKHAASQRRGRTCWRCSWPVHTRLNSPLLSLLSSTWQAVSRPVPPPYGRALPAPWSDSVPDSTFVPMPSGGTAAGVHVPRARVSECLGPDQKSSLRGRAASQFCTASWAAVKTLSDRAADGSATDSCTNVQAVSAGAEKLQCGVDATNMQYSVVAASYIG